MARRGFPWHLLEAIPFYSLDSVATTHHFALDRVIAWTKGSAPYITSKFFEDGWGNFNLFSEFSSEIDSAADLLKRGLYNPPAIEVELEDEYVSPDVDAVLQEGSFLTNFPDARTLLPPESWTAHFQLVTPLSWRDTPSTAPGVDRPVVVLLAGTGEHGFGRRRQALALPLARRGIGCVVLESPYYGRRRPALQSASKLRRVSDLPTLGRATIEEARCLLRWLQDQQQWGPLGVAGSSMGGLHAAMTASLTPFPVACVSWLGPFSAAPVFTKGLLHDSCAWPGLVADAINRRADERLPQCHTNPFPYAPPSANATAIAEVFAAAPLPSSPSRDDNSSGSALAADATSAAAAAAATPAAAAADTLSEAATVADAAAADAAAIAAADAAAAPQPISPARRQHQQQHSIEGREGEERRWRGLAPFVAGMRRVRDDGPRQPQPQPRARPSTLRQLLLDPLARLSPRRRRAVRDQRAQQQQQQQQLGVGGKGAGGTAAAAAATAARKQAWRQQRRRTRRAARRLPLSASDLLGAKHIMYRALALTNIDNFPPPVRSDASIIVTAEHDLYVPPDSTQRWKEHLGSSWPGAEFREIGGGHVSAILFRQTAFRDCIQEALGRVAAVPPTTATAGTAAREDEDDDSD